MDEAQQLVVMQLIMAGGNAKVLLLRQLGPQKAADFEQAAVKLKEADQF